MSYESPLNIVILVQLVRITGDTHSLTYLY